jgi:hypothetical protein
LDEQVANQIAEQLGRLPLALEQAGAYLDRTGMLPTDYIELVRTRAELLYAGRRVDDGSVLAGLWDVSLDRVQSENLASLQLLDICAYFAAEPIPLDLFTNHPDDLPDPATATSDPLAFTDSIAVLVDYSLAKRTPAGLQLHRLVQGALRNRHEHTRTEISGPTP